jgi:hypothetical protein
MRRMLSFTFGVLIGTIVATAATQMNPSELMTNTQTLPVQHHEAI